MQLANMSDQVLTGILRHYLSTLLQSAPKQQAINVLRQQRSLMRGVNLRNNYQQLSPASFAARKAYMIQAYKDGTFLAEPEMRGQPKGNPMSDPAAMEGMMGMMKGQVAMMVPQSLIMGWINAFFSGYVIMKLPFPLTPQFKSMLQSGVGTKDLDVRWVSSLSWYFLTLFGLQPVYNFILGSNNGTSSEVYLPHRLHTDTRQRPVRSRSRWLRPRWVSTLWEDRILTRTSRMKQRTSRCSSITAFSMALRTDYCQV